MKMSRYLNCSKANLLRALVLTIGCLAKFSSGSIFAFNVYSNAIKSTFNYTQSEVLLLASMVNLGLGVGLPAGMVYDRFGPTVTSLVGLLSTSAGYILIWSTFRSREFYSRRSALMSLYFFIVGHGSLYTYMSALGTNVQNFREKHRGKIIGLLDACFGGSPAIFVLVYSAFFANGHVKDQENQNVAGFMLLFAIWFGIVNGLCVLFLRVYPPDQDEGSQDGATQARSGKQSEDKVTNLLASDVVGYASTELQNSINNDDEECPQNPQRGGQLKQMLYLFLQWKFEYLLWMFVLASVVGLAFVNNVTVVTKSVGLSEYDVALTTILPVSGILARFTLGPISDHFRDKVPRVNVLVITNVAFTASQVLCIFLADRGWAFILANVIAGVSIGSLWTFVPAVVSEIYGLKDFGRNWGIIVLVAALVGIGVQETYGEIYTSFITRPDSNNCYGLICVKWNFVLMSGLLFCAVLLNVFLIQITKRNN